MPNCHGRVRSSCSLRDGEPSGHHGRAGPHQPVPLPQSEGAGWLGDPQPRISDSFLGTETNQGQVGMHPSWPPWTDGPGGVEMRSWARGRVGEDPRGFWAIKQKKTNLNGIQILYRS